MTQRKQILGAIGLLLVILTFGSKPYTATAQPLSSVQKAAIVHPATPASALHVSGNQLLNSSDIPVRLLGANRSGTEYACIQGWGIFSGPDDQASLDAMLTWHINAIRVPLNEDCWLNINMDGSTRGGTVYQDAIKNYVSLLINSGITPILDLHWSAPGNQSAVDQMNPMADRDHSNAFWESVATTFKGNNAVIFDLFNEPYPDNNSDTTAAWECWKNGTNSSTCPLGSHGIFYHGIAYEAAGMQELLTTVRNTGATNVIMLGGIQYANVLDQWLTYKPSDPAGELVAAWHVYNGNPCGDITCWNSHILPVINAYPLIAGEIGENDLNGTFITQVMNFLDSPAPDVPAQNYLAWAWNIADFGPYSLITDYYSGNPNGLYGKTYHDHVIFQL
jgi:endoglucanase